MLHFYCIYITYCSFILYVPPLLLSTLFPYTTLFRSSVQSSAFCLYIWWVGTSGGHHGRTAPGDLASGQIRSIPRTAARSRSEEHTSELQSLRHLVCRLLLEKKKTKCTRNIMTRSLEH